MNNKPFIINNRFWVHPDLGLIKEADTANETHIEPRLMHLLCILVMHNHELINRGYLKAKVWNNYGNADEALNQAISYLRKVLADDAKTMIETVPKKGYILRTVIKFDLDKKKTATATGADKQKLYWAAAAILLVLIVAGYFILRPKASAPGASSPDVIQRGLKDTTKGKDTSADEKKAANPDVLPK